MRQKKEEVEAERSQERLGSAIRRRRVELGKSRKDLERESGLSYPYLTEIEAGKKWPSARTLARIAEVLGLDAGELMYLGDNLQMADPAPSLRASLPAPAPVAAPPPPEAESVRRSLWARVAAPEPDEGVDELTRIARALPERDLELLLDFARRMERR